MGLFTTADEIMTGVVPVFVVVPEAFVMVIVVVVEAVMMNVPLLNKVYGAIKQLNEAFSGDKNSFKTVVLVEFPRAGMYSVGFLTSEQRAEVQEKTAEKVVCVFIPTTPNPTSGFLVLVPEDKVTKLEMSVADGIKYIVSLGSIVPENLPRKRED